MTFSVSFVGATADDLATAKTETRCNRWSPLLPYRYNRLAKRKKKSAFCHLYAGPATTLSVNTGKPPGLISPISVFVASVFAVSSMASYGAHSEAIFTKSACHRLSAVISG